MRIALETLPYTEQDETFNRELCASDRSIDTQRLLKRNEGLIRHIAEMFHKDIRIDIPLNEVEHIARCGFLLGCRGYTFQKSFVEFIVFYMEQYIFYQIYTEYFLIKVPIEKRIFIQKLYGAFLDKLNTETGTNYYTALTEAAEQIDMPLDMAVQLLSEFMSLSLREVNEDVFTDEIDKMQKWVYQNKGSPINLTEAPLPFVLVLMEAQMQKKEKKRCHLPFQAICNKFVAVV